MGKIKCLTCDKIVESKYRHELSFCDCGNYIDGGKDYIRCGGNLENILLWNDVKEEWQKLPKNDNKNELEIKSDEVKEQEKIDSQTMLVYDYLDDYRKCILLSTPTIINGIVITLEQSKDLVKKLKKIIKNHEKKVSNNSKKGGFKI